MCCDRKRVTKVVGIAKGLCLSAGDSAMVLRDSFVGEVMSIEL